MKPTHPGTITTKDLATGTATVRPAEDVPVLDRFVFLKNGVQTNDPAEADEAIPIVEVREMPLDDKGDLVPRERATRMRIIELGPEARPLRFSTAVFQKPPQ